jgi:uridine phosphorylase
MDRLISPQQTLEAARAAGRTDADLALEGAAVLTFSATILKTLQERCNLQEASWIGPGEHPYASATRFLRGRFDGVEITALIPPMGASPMACILEDLLACGVELAILLCAAWSLGPPVEMGELIVPTFAIGFDGTSIHYGNENGHASAHASVVDALSDACRTNGVRYHQGGVSSCEALYRITSQSAADAKVRGALCMDNGEGATLFAVTRALDALGGVLFQPYIYLQQGWDPTHLASDRYRKTCELQAQVALDAVAHLGEDGQLQSTTP